MTHTIRKFTIASISALSLLACSVPEPKPLVLTPSLKPLALTSTIGQKQSVGINAIDTRISKKIGDYGPNESLRADVTVNDLGPILTTTFQQGLQNKGFTPVSMTSATGRTLLVSLTSLDLQSSTAMMNTSSNLRVNISIEAVNGNTTMSKEYSAMETSKGKMLSKDERNHIQIDSVISDGVTKVLEDDELMAFLAR